MSRGEGQHHERTAAAEAASSCASAERRLISSPAHLGKAVGIVAISLGQAACIIGLERPHNGARVACRGKQRMFNRERGRRRRKAYLAESSSLPREQYYCCENAQAIEKGPTS